jgi:hypothetical protein
MHHLPTHFQHRKIWLAVNTLRTLAGASLATQTKGELHWLEVAALTLHLVQSSAATSRHPKRMA